MSAETNQAAPLSAHRREIPLRGYVIVLSGTVVWALTGIVIKILLTRYEVDTVTIALWRVLIVTAFVFVALLLLDANSLRVERRDLGIFFVYGLVGIGLHQIVWISSVQFNGAAVATVIIYTGPALVALVAARFLHERMTPAKLIALALTVLGCALVARAYDAGQVALNAVGIAAGIGSACTFATYSLIGRVLSRRYNAWSALFYAFLFGLGFLLPLSLALHNPLVPRLALDGWGWLVFLALVPTLGGFASYTVGLSHLPASVASILAAFEPVTTAIVAYLAFGERLDVWQLIGGNDSDQRHSFASPQMMTSAESLPIFTFHSLDKQSSAISYPPRAFERHIAMLGEWGWSSLDLSEIAAQLGPSQLFPARAFALTFDDGYQNVYEIAFPVLQRGQIRATVFITTGDGKTDYLPSLTGRATLTWAQMREMQKYGIAFGAHTLTHPDLRRVSLARAEIEMRVSRDIVEQALGVPAPCFAYPFGRFNQALRELARQYFDCAVTDKLGLTRSRSDRHALERVDAFYLRSERAFQLVPTRFFGTYLLARALPRRLRRVLISPSLSQPTAKRIQAGE